MTINKKTLMLGLGNTLLCDEGVGIHAIERFRQAAHDWPQVEFLDGGTLSFTLAGPIAEAEQLIVIDATQLHAEPGTVRVFENEAMDEFLNAGNQKSVHEVGLIDLMGITHLSGQLPPQRALIGIQPEYLSWGDWPTPRVAAAIDQVGQEAASLLQRWRQ